MSARHADLPKPTRDLARVKADIDRFGYSLVAEALSPSELKRLRDRLRAVAAAERADGTASVFDKGESQSVNVFVNKGKPFTDLAEHPLCMELMHHILGEHFLLSGANALIKGPGGPAQIVHSDQTYIPEPWQYAATGNVIWMVDDFYEANGATRVVPGSHLRNVNPPGGDYTKDADPNRPPDPNSTQPIEVQRETIPIEAPAGTALVFDGRLWHCGGANTTADQYRHAVITYYCKPFLRQQENFFRSVHPSVLEGASPTLRRLLGYEPYFVLGVASH
jgi:ectoine hydroxylase-related dioxygenase (phytanoyl-CoA dioxygenase family)